MLGNHIEGYNLIIGTSSIRAHMKKLQAHKTPRFIIWEF